MKRPSMASKIAKREGKKVEVSIGNIREIEKIQFELAVEELLSYFSDPRKQLKDCFFIRLHGAAVEEAEKRQKKGKK